MFTRSAVVVCWAGGGGDVFLFKKMSSKHAHLGIRSWLLLSSRLHAQTVRRSRPFWGLFAVRYNGGGRGGGREMSIIKSAALC